MAGHIYASLNLLSPVNKRSEPSNPIALLRLVSKALSLFHCIFDALVHLYKHTFILLWRQTPRKGEKARFVSLLRG